MKTRLCSIFAAVLMLVFLAPIDVVQASNVRYTGIEIIPLSQNLSQINNSLSIKASQATIWVSAVGKSGTKSVQISARLQRKSNGTWVNVATYYGSGTSSASISKTRTLTQKGEYRITTTVTLNGWENLTYYNYAFY